MAISSEQIREDLENLARLTTEKINERAEAIVPPEAMDYIGKERAAMNEKIKVITELGFRVQRLKRNPDDRESLHEAIKTLVSASKDPGESMSLISRIWKYLEEMEKIPFTPGDGRLEPVTFRMHLESWARQNGLEPLTQDEEHNLFDSIRKWRRGIPVKDILQSLDYFISAASHKATFPTRASREYARNAGINRVALGGRVVRLQAIKSYLEKLFAGKPAEADTKPADPASTEAQPE